MIGYGTTTPRAKYHIEVHTLWQLYKAVIKVTWYHLKRKLYDSMGL